ncbi:LD-carboxypeptidase [Oscillatoria sp. FACHB-1407]|uniref:S66 peptidase family protein n=1 Tax=Oscillatoria sp. FACHB-1407 TaxID=2692847 RepID=UPI0016861087|nr:LD-carboxypeptidase [Oscillatoria sp. FACHB-1407]MBD2464059.1 LD-carboxypeptidase [Oscillatoria sp. FACHB-1407]
MLPCKPPTPLQSGDLLCVIAPSGTLREQTAFAKGVEIWRSHGYRVELSPGYDDRWGYLAGKDDHRRQQLYKALTNPDCRGVLCARGGYGGARLLEEWQWVETEPKWLIGFSDITSLLWGLSRQGISGLHAPLLTTLAAEPDWSVQRLFDWVQGRSLPALQGVGWGGGTAQGLLLPANLTVATHLLHTAVQPDLEGVILALEDVSEAPYRIDRMLTQWRMTGIFHKIRGIAVGRFSQCDPPPNIPSFTIEEVLRDRLADLGIPIVSELPFGHDGVNAALPVGVPVELDGDRGTLGAITFAF